jgi:hypothetical protein
VALYAVMLYYQAIYNMGVKQLEYAVGLTMVSDQDRAWLGGLPVDVAPSAERLLSRVRKENRGWVKMFMRDVTSLFIERKTDREWLLPESDDFLSRYSASPMNNHLGTVTCFGTPFIEKKWRQGLFSRIRRTLLPWIGWLIFSTLKAYAFGVVLLGLAALFGADWSWLPHKWPMWILIITVPVAIWNIVRGLGDSQYRDGNLYCNHGDMREMTPPEFLERRANVKFDGKIPALIVTSSFSDEAVLGLGSDGLAVAALRAKMRDLAMPAWLKRRSKKLAEPDHPEAIRGRKEDEEVDSGGLPSGLRRTKAGAASFILDSLIGKVVRYTIGLPIYVLRVIVGFLVAVLVEPLLAAKFHDATSMLALGIEPFEYDGAAISVKPVPDVNLLVTHVIDHTDLRKLRDENGHGKASDEGASLISNEEAMVEGSDGAGTESTKKEDGDKTLDKNPWWTIIKPELPFLAKYYERKDLETFVEESKGKWIALERQARSVLGDIDLNHSVYHQSEEMSKVVARFIATGSPEKFEKDESD